MVLNVDDKMLTNEIWYPMLNDMNNGNKISFICGIFQGPSWQGFTCKDQCIPFLHQYGTNS